jgi:transcriptional regulator of arginine metabolism
MPYALQRRDEIVRIVTEQPVHSQEELQALLRKRGFRVTQPTLSRDLRDLGLAKTPSGYVLTVANFTPRESREEQLEAMIEEFVLSAAVSGTLVVVRTPPAAAQPVAHAIDEAGIEGVVGTIGGDDAIFVALDSHASAQAFAQRLVGYLSPVRSRRARP